MTVEDETLDFRKMLDEVSKNFGFKELAIGGISSKSTLIPHQNTDSKRGTNRLDDDSDQDLKMDGGGKGKSVTDLMKDTHMVERYSQYLNKAMFLASDPFIKRKYQQFMSTKVVEKKETFYDRMEKDRHRREELAKQNS